MVVMFYGFLLGIFNFLRDLVTSSRPLPFGGKGPYEITTDSQQVSWLFSNHVFFKSVCRISLKLHRKLGCFKGKQRTEPEFWEKESWGKILGEEFMGKKNTKIAQNRFSWVLSKVKPIAVNFLSFKWRTVAFFIIPHAWEKSGSQVIKSKKAKSKIFSTNQIARFFKL